MTAERTGQLSTGQSSLTLPSQSNSYSNRVLIRRNAPTATPKPTLRAPFYQPEMYTLQNSTTIGSSTSWRAHIVGISGAHIQLNFMDIVTAITFNITEMSPKSETLTNYHSCLVTESVYTWCSSSGSSFHKGTVESLSGTASYSNEPLGTLTPIIVDPSGRIFRNSPPTWTASVHWPQLTAQPSGSYESLAMLESYLS
jgi:hypothetical protein